MPKSNKSYRLKVWGDFACFTRPELKVERVSYDVITPSAARAIYEAILWSPCIEWVIEKIEVLNPVKWISVRRNEISSRTSLHKELYIEEERVQRASLLLKDVSYIIHAKLKTHTQNEVHNKQFNAIFERRASKGQCFTQPYLGCREFPAYFKLLEEEIYEPIQETRDLGRMLHDMEYDPKEISPYFFSAFMEHGQITIPPKSYPKVQE